MIADAYVDKAFGTGAVKITPAHDFNDWEVGQRHGLVPITIFTLDAKLNANAPEKYRGLDRYVARKAVLDRSAKSRDSSKREAAQDGGTALRPHGRGDRADAHGPVVRRHEQARARVARLPSPANRSGHLPRRPSTRALPATGGTPFDHDRASFPSTGRRPTTTGWRTCTTGASRASCGGVIASPRGTTTPATSSSRATSRKRRASRASRRAALRQDRRRARHLVLVRPVVPFDARLAGENARARDVPAELGARDRLRHHFLLGRAHDHDDDLLHRQASFPRRVHQLASCATTKARRCRSRRATSSIRSI